MRYAFFALFLLAVLLVSLTGQRGKLHTERALRLFPDMDEQQMVRPQAASELFADGLGSRRPVAQSIPMGYDRSGMSRISSELEFTGYAQTGAYQTGKIGENFIQGYPEELSLGDLASAKALLARGQQRYDIHCAICHGAAGDGKGVAARPDRLSSVANLLEDRFAPAKYSNGQVFDVISNGKGLMVSYGDKITLRDRWAIVAYVRALQEADNPESYIEGIADALSAAEEEVAAPAAEEGETSEPEAAAEESPGEEPATASSAADTAETPEASGEVVPSPEPSPEPAPETSEEAAPEEGSSQPDSEPLPTLPGATSPPSASTLPSA